MKEIQHQHLKKPDLMKISDLFYIVPFISNIKYISFYFLFKIYALHYL